MPRTRKKLQDALITFRLPASMARRIEAVAPVTEGRRAEFLRRAVEAELQRVEREQASEAA